MANKREWKIMKKATEEWAWLTSILVAMIIVIVVLGFFEIFFI